MNSKVLVVTSAKGNKKGRRPKIALSGLWLDEIGFIQNSLVNVQCSSKNILLRLCNMDSISHSELSKRIVREDSKGIFHVGHQWSKKKKYPVINLAGFWLEKYDFTIGGFLAINYDYGIINIHLLELHDIPDLQNQSGKELA